MELSAYIDRWRPSSLRELAAVGTSTIVLIAAETLFLTLLVLGWIMRVHRTH